MAFRKMPRTFIVGRPTAGADGDISKIRLPGGYSVAISALGVFYPDKTPTQQIGILPDILVYPTHDDILAGRDEVLTAAMEKLLEQQD